MPRPGGHLDFRIVATVSLQLLYVWLLIDHGIVFGEGHLRRLLADYVAYYNAERVHTGLGDSPDGRPIEPRPSPTARVLALPRVGGLHHRYVWAKAA